MPHIFVTSIVSPPSAPSLLLRLENAPIPGRPENYRIFCQRPAPRTHHQGENPQDVGIEPEVWEVSVDLAFIEWFHQWLDQPISLKDCRTFPIGLDLPCYEVLLGEGWYGAHFRWSGPVPEGWESLSELVGKLLHRGRPQKYFYDY